MTTYTARLGTIDEDGYRSVEILRDGELVDHQYLRYDIAGQWTAQEIEILQAMNDNPGECEHGLSAALCAGSMHYPV